MLDVRRAEPASRSLPFQHLILSPWGAPQPQPGRGSVPLRIPDDQTTPPGHNTAPRNWLGGPITGISLHECPRETLVRPPLGSGRCRKAWGETRLVGLRVRGCEWRAGLERSQAGRPLHASPLRRSNLLTHTLTNNHLVRSCHFLFIFLSMCSEVPHARTHPSVAAAPVTTTSPCDPDCDMRTHIPHRPRPKPKQTP